MNTYPPYVAYPSAPEMVRAAPPPPKLHWGIVLVLSIFTLGFFNSVWMIVQANWVRRVTGTSRALPWTIANACILPVLFLLGFTVGVYLAATHTGGASALGTSLDLFGRLISVVGFLVASFTLRTELMENPFRQQLSGIMTFFFSGIYFQYHLHDLEITDEMHAYRGPVRPELAPVVPGEPRL